MCKGIKIPANDGLVVAARPQQLVQKVVKVRILRQVPQHEHVKLPALLRVHLLVLGAVLERVPEPPQHAVVRLRPERVEIQHVLRLP